MTTLTTRAGKGSPLTNNEMDANLNNLNDYKVEKTSGTGSAQLPSGTTAQRDGSPSAGYMRFNTTTGETEYWNGTAWVMGGGALIENAPVGIGYGPGAGGTVTQATSKSTTVTLNRPCGKITTNNANLGAGAIVGFSVMNALCDINTITNVTISGASASLYNVWAEANALGFNIWIRNLSAGTLGEAIPINFAILKGVTA